MQNLSQFIFNENKLSHNPATESESTEIADVARICLWSNGVKSEGNTWGTAYTITYQIQTEQVSNEMPKIENCDTCLDITSVQSIPNSSTVQMKKQQKTQKISISAEWSDKEWASNAKLPQLQ